MKNWSHFHKFQKYKTKKKLNSERNIFKYSKQAVTTDSLNFCIFNSSSHVNSTSSNTDSSLRIFLFIFSLQHPSKYYPWMSELPISTIQRQRAPRLQGVESKALSSCSPVSATSEDLLWQTLLMSALLTHPLLMLRHSVARRGSPLKPPLPLKFV